MKPILCLDFDGVCHSYTSGWQGAGCISDPPVDGMWDALRRYTKVFTVHIFSSRTHQPGGKEAMYAWFVSHAIDHKTLHIAQEELQFPLEKPAALVTLDDRALTFDGRWPTAEFLAAFKPWNKR